MPENTTIGNSKTLQIGICDDDNRDLENYSQLITTIAQANNLVVKITTFNNGINLLYSLEDNELPIDILFLDYNMPNANGIQIASRMRKKNNFKGEIIFLTKYDNHAIEAFDVEAFNYIVKDSLNTQRFEEIFLRACQKVNKKNRKRIVLRGLGEYRSIDVESIYYFEIVHRVVTVHYDVPEKTFDFYCPLSKLEAVVLPFNMIRTHNSYIVKMDKVKSFNKSELKLINGEVLPISRSKYNLIKEACSGMVVNNEK